MIDPFRDGRCSCPTGREIATAAVLGETLAPSCELHQADAIKAHERAQARETAQRRLAREQQIYEEFRAPREPAPPSCSCNLRADVATVFAGGEVAPCAVHRPPQPEGSNVNLGTDELTQILAEKVGATIESPPQDA